MKKYLTPEITAINVEFKDVISASPLKVGTFTEFDNLDFGAIE